MDLYQPPKPAIIRAVDLPRSLADQRGIRLVKDYADQHGVSFDEAAQIIFVRKRKGGIGGIDANTVLMLHCDGSNGSTTFTDVSGTPKTVAANGNAQISTADSKFGGASALFDGNGDYLAITDHADFSWAGQFTVDCWLKTSTYSINTFYRRAISIGDGIELVFFNGSGASPNISFTSATFNVINGNIDAANGAWHHVALSRDGSNNCRLFVDGVQSGSTASNSSSFNPTNIHIGKYSGGAGGYFDGYIDEIRFSNIARWTSSFTPPAAPYSN